jgi:hypothetical protein
MLATAVSLVGLNKAIVAKASNTRENLYRSESFIVYYREYLTEVSDSEGILLW